mgnify:CR=1 FL=1|tara:strand:- start:134 stop:1003 length:870 start_codon:yes stop_codon:yes gene_type:complete
MKKNIIFLLFNFIILTTVAQTYEDKIASKTCNCISLINAETDVNTSFKRCILQSKFEIDRNDSIEKPTNNIEGMRQIFQTVSDLVNKNCNALRTKKSEHQKVVFYIQSSNKEAAFNFNKGNKLLKNNEYPPAIKAYRKAVLLDPNFVLAYDQLGITYKKQEEFTKAIKAYKKSLKLFPEGDIALQNIAEIYYLNGDNKDASKYFTAMIILYPENPDAYFGFAKTAMTDELYDSALIQCLVSLKYYKKIDTAKIKEVNHFIKSIYSAMDTKGQLAAFNAIAKENNFELTK